MSLSDLALTLGGSAVGIPIGQLGMVKKGIQAAATAYKAGKIAKNVYQTVSNFMPKGKGVSKRKASRDGVKKRIKKAATGTKRGKAKIGTYAGRMPSALEVGNQSARIVNHKKVKDSLKVGRPYGVKVDKLFRRKVLKTLTDNKVHGYARLYKVGGTLQLASSSGVGGRDSLEQWVFALPTGSNAVTASNLTWGKMRIGDAQSLIEQLYCVSRLFNGQPAIVNPSSIVYNMFGVMANPVVGGARSALKYEVLDSKTIINMVNNSKMAVHIEMYVCKPKMQRTNQTVYPAYSCTAIDDWQDLLEAEKTTTVKGGEGTYPVVIGQNLSSRNVRDLGMSPEQHQSWKKLWQFEKFVFTLEPGQRHSHTVIGETGVCDWSKFYKEGQFQNLQKWDRQVFFVAKPELSARIQDGLCSGRFNQSVAENIAQLGLLFEVQSIYKFSMPETTGLQVTSYPGVSAAGQPLHYRRPCYIVDYISDVATGSNYGTGQGLEKRVDDNVPDATTV